MGTEVLRPQEFLTEPVRFNSRRKPYYSGTKPGRKPFVRSESKKRVLDESTKNNGFVLGEVRVLKRGESIELKKNNDVFVSNKNQILNLKISNSSRSEETYAGSVVYSSPSPRKVPLPSFSKKNDGLMMNTVFSEEFVTKDLRRLLRIE
ncbi:hypothetical protein ACHQM5_014869 [Ranunculus cassubicifolius]